MQENIQQAQEDVQQMQENIQQAQEMKVEHIFLLGRCRILFPPRNQK